MLDHSVGSGQHTYKDRGPDCYETPPEAVHALVKVEPFLQRSVGCFIWEPACGPGSIVHTLRELGHTVYASDLHDYDCPDSEYALDFLDYEASADSNWDEVILTNPPYKIADKFVEKALSLNPPMVIMLLRLAFLEGKKRSNILENRGLARVHVFRNRLPMMHRRGWNGPKASSAIPFAWFVWERGYQGPTTIDRISWEHAT